MDINIKMDEIVNFYLDQYELPDSQYGRIHGLGVRGYRQVYLHATAAPQTVELEVLGNRTAPLPCDCINKISLGVLNSLGEIAPLTEDVSLGFGNGSSNARTTKTTPPLLVDNESGIFYDPDGNHLTPFIFGQFGSGARSDLGFYRIDWKARQVVLDFNFNYGSVWLEYLPVYSNDGVYDVSPFFLEAILAFIGWNDPRRSPGERGESKGRWFNEFRIGRRSMHPLDLSQVFLQYARTTRQARY